MSTILDSPSTAPIDVEVLELEQEIAQVELLEEDGVPLESAWHRDNINLLVNSLKYHWRGRTDFYVGGNMCVYYSLTQAKNREFLGPDVFVVNGDVDGATQRSVWAIWNEENRGLDIAIELLSPSTATHDRTTKKAIFERRLKTPEYFCYEPETKRLEGWRLNSDWVYQPLEPSSNGMLWSVESQLWLGTWDGEYNQTSSTWLRWFDQDGQLCLLPEESEMLRADEADRRAAEATARADKAEAELQRLRELLAAQKRD